MSLKCPKFVTFDANMDHFWADLAPLAGDRSVASPRGEPGQTTSHWAVIDNENRFDQIRSLDND